MRPYPVDLFGEVVITSTNIGAWLCAVPKIDPKGPRAVRYVSAWSVSDKIRFAKLEGHFEATIERPSPAVLCRLHWP